MARPPSTSVILLAFLCSSSGVQARLPSVASSSASRVGACRDTGTNEVLEFKSNKKRAVSPYTKQLQLPSAAKAAIKSRGGGAAAASSAQLDTSKSIKWPVFIAFLYYLSIAMTAPALPAFCNQLFADGNYELN